MTIKDGIKFKIGLEVGGLLVCAASSAILETAYILTKDKTFNNVILQAIQQNAAEHNYKSRRVSKPIKKPIKNVIGFSIN